MGVLDIMEQLGITWTATDEANLAKSLGIAFERDEHMDIKHPEILYKPYQIKGKPLSLFFRDHYLSDLIGFHYQSVPAKKAAQDFVQRIKRIRITSNSTPVVPIILDGENAWEYYPESGREFLSEFFRLVTDDEQLETITFSQASKMERGIISNLQTGSWINGNFDIWIGHEEDRKAWKWIERAKEAVLKREKELTQEKKEKIREYLSIAQGSDWFWWFGAENFTPDLDIFDDLFRKNVQKLFELSGNDVPYELTVPIAHRVADDTGNIVLPARKISPPIDGKSSGYFEWLYAGYIDTRAFGGAMNISNPIMKRVYFGFSDTELFLKIEVENSPAHYFENDYQLEIRLQKVELDKTTLINRFVFPDKGNNSGVPSYRFAAENHIEIALSLKELQVREGDSFKIRFHWKYKGELFLEVPRHDYLLLYVPTQRNYAAFWMV